MSMLAVAGETVIPVRADHYAPSYEIAVAGVVLGTETMGDILDIQVTRELKNASSASVTVSDWDSEKVGFKYSSTDTFNLGKPFTVRLGYARLPTSATGALGATPSGQMSRVFSGVITSLSPRFPDGSPPSLTIAGQDALRTQLSNRKPAGSEPRYWLKKTDSEIVRDIATRLGFTPKVETTATRHPKTVIKNQDYASFLVERAAKNDFEVVIDAVLRERTNKLDTVLYFGPRSDGREQADRRVLTCEWGVDLISFTPRLSSAQQVRSVTVRGWDPIRKKAIEVTVSGKDLKGPAGQSKGGPASAEVGTNEVVVDQPVSSEQEARELAKARLQEKANLLISGSGKLIGQPELVPGDTVRLKGLGSRFDLGYQVQKVVHTLGSGGFTTEFEVSNAAAGPTGGRS